MTRFLCFVFFTLFICKNVFALDLSSERDLRQRVSDGMLEIYSQEVPLFKVLHQTINKRNAEFVEAAKTDDKKRKKLAGANLDQLGNIRHAAVRLALPEEMQMLVRIGNQMGQFPVAYYDLTTSGTPVKSTVLRPIHDDELLNNAFTIFSSMLDVDAMDFSSDPELKKVVNNILDERRKKHFAGKGTFPKEIIELVEIAETKGLDDKQKKQFVDHTIAIFKLNRKTLIDKSTYLRIKEISPVAADILGAGLNINHLTPDTPDIEGVYDDMVNQINPVTHKNVVMNGFIYGPKRSSVLLEQTSFKAVKVNLETSDSQSVYHQARFGEVESRGIATTPTGRQRYDLVLDEINSIINVKRELFKSDLLLQGKKYEGDIRDQKESELGREYIKIASKKFPFILPNDERELALHGLAYFKYEVKNNDKELIDDALENTQKSYLIFADNEADYQKSIVKNLIPTAEALVEKGVLERKWIKYRDFLPASAAGIFSSNRDKDSQVSAENKNDIALWYKNEVGVINFYNLYESEQAKSLQNVFKTLKIEISDEDLKALNESAKIGDANKLLNHHRKNVIPKLRNKFLGNKI